MKKVKEKKELDYSRMPEHIWEKQLNEFLEFMKQLEVQVHNASKMGDFIERTYERDRRISMETPEDKEALDKFESDSSQFQDILFGEIAAHAAHPANTPYYQIAINTVLALMQIRPEVTADSPEGVLLNLLSEAIEKYENKYWPIPDTPHETGTDNPVDFPPA